MKNQQYTDCNELFDDDGEGICDGQVVLVNGSHKGRVHLDGRGNFQIEGWTAQQVIESLEVIPEDVPFDTANMHPTIKE